MILYAFLSARAHVNAEGQGKQQVLCHDTEHHINNAQVGDILI